MDEKQLSGLVEGTRLTRRGLLRRSAGLATGALALGGFGSLLTACGGAEDTGGTSPGGDSESTPADAGTNETPASDGEGSTGGGNLVIYNWYQPWIKEVYPMFAEEAGVEVTQLGTYSSNDEWWARLNAGESFDFFIPTTDWVQRAMAADLLHPLDLDQIPNYSNLFPDYQNLEIYQKDGNTYAVPFFRVIYALTYNSEEFPEPPDSWAVTWDEQYSGKITLQDQAYARIGITALLLGENPLNPQSWDEIKQRLLDQKPMVKKYWKDYQNGMELFVNGEAVVGQLTAGRSRMAKDEGAPIEWTVPSEGSLIFVDCLAIPKTAENPENAHKFINFLLEPEITLKEMRGMKYDTLNEAAYGELSEEEVNAFTVPKGANLVISTDLSPEVRQQMDTLWNEVKLS